MIAPGLAGAMAARFSRRGAAALAAVALLGLSFLWCREQSRWRDRISLYERIAGDAPEAAMPHYNLGNVMREAGRIDDASREYRTALRLDPDHPAARCNLGVMLAENVGDPREALQHLRTCLALSPQAPNRDRVLQLIRWLESHPPARPASAKPAP
jgi:tetratricopeptide (TPR) repeat protein